MIKKIKTVGVVGLGAIGTSMAYILQQAGLNVIGFKRSKVAQQYRNSMRQGNVKIINNSGYKRLPLKDSLNIKIVESLDDIAHQADLILNACLFPQGLGSYRFNAKQQAIIQKNGTAIITIPGKLGSTWLLRTDNMATGLAAYAPVFASKTIDPNNQITITIRGFKSKIPFAHHHPSTKYDLLDFFNQHFQFQGNTPTFMDGGTPLQTALSSPVAAINSVAICAQADKLVQAQSKPIKAPIYALDEVHSGLLQAIYQEQVKVANALNIRKMPTLKDWLKNRPIPLQSTTVTALLQEIYSKKMVTISQTDRRIVESSTALLFFKYFAHTLGIRVPATTQVLSLLDALKQRLNQLYPIMANDFYIKQTATAYARYSLEHYTKSPKTTSMRLRRIPLNGRF